MPVEKIYLHRRPRRCVTWITLGRAVLRSSRGLEVHLVRLRFLVRGGGYPTPSPFCRPPMLRPHVTRQRPKRHLLPALLTRNPSLLPLLVLRALSCHPSPLHHLRLSSRRLERAADHADFLPSIGPQACLIKQSDQGAKISLEPSQVQRCNHAIVRVE